jgi:nucleoid DNA-binding protein
MNAATQSAETLPSPTASTGLAVNAESTEPKEPRVVYIYDLAKYLHDLLQLPYPPNGDPKTGRKIIAGIKKAITDALHRGEDVKIKGFGIFRVVNHKPTRVGSTFITQDPIFSPVPIDVKGYRYVKFYPSSQLRAMLNGGTTYDERKAMKLWSQ